MIYDITNKTHQKKLFRICLEKGKLINQITMLSLGLSVPDSLIIQDYDRKVDTVAIERFLSIKDAEYQVRSENIGKKLRYSESFTGLSAKQVHYYINKLSNNGNLLLIQRLPKRALYRDSHSVQYFIEKDKLIMEIRAGIATHLARFGWPPSEYYEIPLSLKNLVFSNFNHISDNKTLKINIALDCMDFGLRVAISNLSDIILLPYDKELKRLKKLYEISPAELKLGAFTFIINRAYIETCLIKLKKKIKQSHLKTFCRAFHIPAKIQDQNFGQFLTYLGFLYHISQQDQWDSLKQRLFLFLERGILYSPLSNDIVNFLLKDAIKCKVIIKNAIAKLSIVENENGNNILYWDIIQCTGL